MFHIKIKKLSYLAFKVDRDDIFVLNKISRKYLKQIFKSYKHLDIKRIQIQIIFYN